MAVTVKIAAIAQRNKGEQNGHNIFMEASDEKQHRSLERRLDRQG
jgi:hypothetical protein